MRLILIECCRKSFLCYRSVVSVRSSFIIRDMSSTSVPLPSDQVGQINKNRVAISHMRATNNKSENLEQVRAIVARAKEGNAQFVFLPECCDFVGENRRETLELAEPLDGPIVEEYRKLARTNRIWMSLGGIHESILDEVGKKTEKINNAHIIIDNNGDLVATYRKLHLFDVETPEFRFRESDVVAKGETIISPISTPIGAIGMQICYDVRFPEVATILRKQGAEILTYPSAFAYSTGKAHWEILLKARAIENQCYVIAPAQIGFHNAKRQSYGHAMIIGPWGQTIVECKEADLDVAIGELDLNEMQKVRKNMPCFSHRRDDVYNLAPIRISNSSAIRVDGVCEELKFGNFVIPDSTIFFKSKHCFAFTNIRCVVPGHVLVATKRQVPRLKDMSGDEITDFFQSVCKIQKCTEAYYRTTSSTVTVQDGVDAGQTVQHVHCHIMPRKRGDFDHNDQIYIELNRHDHGDNMERRPVDEMQREAEEYRKYFKK